MKQGWEIKKLGDVCELYQPKTISSKEMVDDGDYPVFGANGIIGKYDKYNHEEPQLLITCRGATCGSINISEPKSWINGNAMVVRPKDNSLNLKFIEYLFLGGIDISKTITGAAQPQITRQTLSPVLISYPKSLPEQQRIVAILDEAFASIAKAKTNAEQNLKNAKELFESYLQRVFENGNWEEKKLNEITEVKDGTHDSPKYIKEGIPFVTQKNVRQDGLSFSDTRFITETDHEKFYKRSNVTYGDILISMIGANRGMAAIVDDKRIFSIKNVGMIKESKNINKNFLLYYLKSSLAMKYVLYMSNGGAQEFVGLTALRSFPIPYPTIKEQDAIVKKLDAISSETNKLVSIYQNKIESLEELKKSVLQKAFSGELKVSELGFDGLKDDRIFKKDKEEILKSTNPKNHNSDNDGLKDDRINEDGKSKILKSSNPKNHNSDNDGLKDDRINEEGKSEILKSSNLKYHNSDNDGLKDDRINEEGKSKILKSSNPKNHNSDNDGLNDDRIKMNAK